MAIIINDNLAINVGKPVDSKYMNIATPWTSVLDANTNIPLSYRYLGLTVNVNNVEYWYQNSLADVGLVIKSLGGTLTGATNGLTIAGAKVRLGGTITGTTTFIDSRLAPRGLEYGADYSTTFTARSLVDRGYVDGVASGLKAKEAVLVASSSNVTPFLPTGLTTFDGVPLSVGDRILFKNQINGIENGIYSASTGTWGRTDDFDGTPSGEVASGVYMWVLSGNTNKGTAWVLNTDNPIIGLSALTFVQFNQVAGLTGGVGIIVSAQTGNYIISFDGANVAGSGLTWNGTQLNVVDISDMSGATNGLTRVGANATLGGTLTGNTFIELPVGVKRSFIVGQDDTNWHGGRIEVCTDSILTGDTAFIGARHDATCYSQIQITAMSGMTMTSCYEGGSYGDSHLVRLGNRALEYGGNYYSDFNTNPRSIPDVAFVTGQTGSISAVNGLNRSGNNVVLGGSMTGDTVINGVGYDLSLGSSSNRFDKICLDAQGILMNSSGATYIDARINPATQSAIEYGACYHAGYTNRTLVDKEYVDIKVVSTIPVTGATNGLTLTNSKVILGGALTGTTTVNINNNSLRFISDSGTTYGLVNIGMNSTYANSKIGICSRDGSGAIWGWSGNSTILISYHYANATNGNSISINNSNIVMSNLTGASPKTVCLGTSGMTYAACYHPSYSSRSLVDKEFVQNCVAEMSNIIHVTNTGVAGYTATLADDFIGVSGSTCVCLYPTPIQGQKVIVSDICGNALNTQIFINGNGKKINDGLISTISTNYGAVTYIYNGYCWSTIAFVN